jgi:hypothetical protein
MWPLGCDSSTLISSKRQLDFVTFNTEFSIAIELDSPTIIIHRLLLSVYLSPKVITLSGSQPGVREQVRKII